MLEVLDVLCKHVLGKIALHVAQCCPKSQITNQAHRSEKSNFFFGRVDHTLTPFPLLCMFRRMCTMCGSATVRRYSRGRSWDTKLPTTLPKKNFDLSFPLFGGMWQINLNKPFCIKFANIQAQHRATQARASPKEGQTN